MLCESRSVAEVESDYKENQHKRNASFVKNGFVEGEGVWGQSFALNFNYTNSIVVTTCDYLFTGGSQQNVVFELCGVAAGDVGQRWVRIYNFGVTKKLKRADVFGVKFFEPFACESERTEVILDRVEKSFCIRVPEDWVFRMVKV